MPTTKNPVEFSDDSLNQTSHVVSDASLDARLSRDQLVNMDNRGNITRVEQSPMAMMIQAKQAGFSTDEIKEMMDLQDRNDARLAKQAFFKAMADFKRNPPKVVKDLLNKQFGSNYTSIGNMVNSVNESMAPFGLNARWSYPDTGDKSLIRVICHLAHELGHEISVDIDSPIDVSGSKNPLQGRKSTRTYLKLETFEAVTGMVSVEGNVNDDGNGATKPIKLITDNQQNIIHSSINENGLKMNIIIGWLGTVIPGVDSIASIPAANYTQVMQKIKKAISEKNK